MLIDVPLRAQSHPPTRAPRDALRSPLRRQLGLALGSPLCCPLSSVRFPGAFALFVLALESTGAVACAFLTFVLFAIDLAAERGEDVHD